MGGLPRRATVLEQLDTAGSLLVVDAGDFAWKNTSLTGLRAEQQRIEGRLVLDSMALSGIDGLAVGDSDLSLGVQWLLDATEEAGVPLLSANLRCEGFEPFVTARLVERAGLRIGITAVLDTNSTLPEMCRTVEPSTAVFSALEDLGPLDLRVVLSHQRSRENEALVEGLPLPVLVISGDARSGSPEPEELADGALQVAAGSRGRTLGVLSLEFGAERNSPSVDNQLIHLDRSIEDHAETLVLVENAERESERASREAAGEVAR